MTAGIDTCVGGHFARHPDPLDIGNDGWRATMGAPDATVAEAVTKQKLVGVKLRAHLASTLPYQVRFSLAVEQLPSSANRVSIDAGCRDPLGNPRPVISYHIDDYTRAGMAAATDVYRKVFRRARIADCTSPAEGTWFPSVTYGDDTFHYHGMGHSPARTRWATTPISPSSTATSARGAPQSLPRRLRRFPTMGTSIPR